MTTFYNKTAKSTLAEFSVDPETGLSSREVLKRRAKYGENSLHLAETPLWRKLLEPFLDVFMLILVVAFALSIVQRNWVEAIAIGVIIIADTIIYYIQRFSTDRILRSLANSTRQSVSVLRDGSEQSLDASELVPGDIVILREGDRIPADGRIIRESGLLADEAMLTGESEAIAKDARAISGPKKVYEQRNMVFSGSFVLTGSGRFVITATGDNTEYGRIASLASSAESSSPISEKINRLVVKIAIVVVLLAAIVLAVQLGNGIEIFSALKYTLAMIVSAVPESLPIAISIILALCAKRMAGKHALIKELKAIESVGIVTTIASDKTGTLTENRLELREIWTPGTAAHFRQHLARTALREAALINGDGDSTPADPLDTAIINYLSISGRKVDFSELEPLRSYAFDQTLKLSGNLFRAENCKNSANADSRENPKNSSNAANTGALTLALKGAPEAIINRSELSLAEREIIEIKLTELASKGYKVVAIASLKINREINELVRLEKNDKFQFEGFIAIADALRPEASSAIKQNARMGVKTKMVTGDHAGTAYAIGRELGLAHDLSEVLDCSKLGHISDEDLIDIVKNTTVFARVTPEDKFRILGAIKESEICAMTGDGVNDVPALVGAHVGIAMGDSPSVVQDAGDIVLLDNNFKNITEAIRESRTVLANIRRMLSYLLATNAGEALTMIGSLILFSEQMLTPIQILWVNLVTDSLLVIPLGLEPDEAEVLRKKPRSKSAPILPAYMITRMIIIAIIMSSLTLATYYFARNLFGSHAVANTLAFTALVAMQWSSALSARGIYASARQRLKVRHRGFWWALCVAILLQVAALFGPLALLVGTVSVPLPALALTAAVAFIVPLAAIEIYKRYRTKV